MNAAADAVVYLLHIDPPYRHARHVLGWTRDLPLAIGEHWSGRTRSGIVRAALDAGSKVVVARKWRGGAEEAARLRGTRSLGRYCPRCRRARRLQRQDENMEALLERSIERARARARKKQ